MTLLGKCRLIVVGSIGVIWVAGALPVFAALAESSQYRCDSTERGTYPSGLTMMRSGEVKPQGWILEQMRGDLNEGYVGSFDKISEMAAQNLFGKNKADYENPLPKFTACTWWSGEVEAHWMDAVTRIAFLTGDDTYKGVARRWVKDVMAHQAEDGYIGIYKPELRFNHQQENGELWVMSRALLVLLAYYEYTDDSTCLDAVRDAVALVMSKYDVDHPYFKSIRGGGLTHGLAFVDVLEWLWRITADERYRKFAVFLYEDFSKHSTEVNRDMRIQNLLDRNAMFQEHGAHIGEQFMIPFFVACATGQQRYRQAANNALEKLRFHFTPGGSIPSVESVQGKLGTADSLREYCTTNESLRSLNRVVMITGDVEAADWSAKLVMNAAQGARLHPYLTAVEYCSSDNRVEIDERAHGGRLMYSVCHRAAACCAMSAARLMSYYVESLWMQCTDRPGLVAMQFGPCVVRTTVNGVGVKITEETDYPFSDEVIFTVDPDRETDFVLRLRKPAEAVRIQVDPICNAQVIEGRDFVTLRRQWRVDDVIRVQFPFVIRKVWQPASATVQSNRGGYYLRRGPLVFALPFPFELEVIREFGATGFKSYRVNTKDKTGWDYAIDPNEQFQLTRADDGDFLHPWAKPPVLLSGRLLDPGGRKVQVKLVPEGSTVLRRVTFPIR